MFFTLLLGGPDYQEVTSLTGRIWLDRNLGASRVATSPTDTAAYGDMYQWGRLTDGHQRRTSPVIADICTSNIPGHGNYIKNDLTPFDWRSPQNNNLWQGVPGTNNPCPSDFRLPTSIEFIAERGSWISADSAGAFASPLKLVTAGVRDYYSGTIRNAGIIGYYWSSTVSDIRALSTTFSDSNANGYGYQRAGGMSIRCIKD